MRKNILLFGAISGLIITTNLVVMMTKCNNNPEFESNDVLGYAAFIVAFSFIFFGIKNFRDKHNNGVITFGQGFKMGFLMAVVAATMYVVIGITYYYVFVPGFFDQYIQHELYMAKLKGLSEGEIAEKAKQLAEFKELHKNPLFVIFISYAEVLPTATVIALISALILKRKPGLEAAAGNQPVENVRR
jgi:hypothetical protein